jgi:F0F1-type ATP synthase membrane subunit c/vacuolar-type H+-ATPase subunit K
MLDPGERSRRIAALVHTALLASVGIYAVVLVFLRSEIAAAGVEPPEGYRLFLVLAGLGLAQFAAASLAGRAMLRSSRSGAVERVRLYFLLRAAAAEAIALYGFVLGLLGGPAPQVAGLFALAIAALLACAPGRGAWEAALVQASPR